MYVRGGTYNSARRCWRLTEGRLIILVDVGDDILDLLL
jgi:hypothetical protein